MSGEERILGRWRLTREIGRGGMGQVWHAVLLENLPPDGYPNQAAIKILPASLTREPGIALRFQREMEILGKLSHPGIVTFLEATNAGESLGFAMEFVDGCSLQELLQSRGALAWEDVIALALQICQPLKHAHDRGVIHRDLKPSNILVKGWPDCPQIKLTDFGVASLFASRKLTATGGLVGTAETIAPEQVAGKPATKRSDLYSLGVVIYTLITGQFPFRGHLAEVLHKQRFGQHERLSHLVDGLPPELERLVDELLAKDPSARPPDAGLVARRLQVIARKDQLIQGGKQTPLADGTPLESQDFPLAGEGPATFVSRMVRAHLNEQNRGGIWSRMMRNPWIVAPMLGLVFAALIWVVWPTDEKVLLDEGIRLMGSSDPLDRKRGWEDFLEPLYNRSNPEAPVVEFESFRQMYQDALMVLEVQSRTRSADVQTDAEWAYLCSRRLEGMGYHDAANRILHAIVIAYRNQPLEAPWVRKAEGVLGNDLAKVARSFPLRDREDALLFLEKTTALGSDLQKEQK